MTVIVLTAVPPGLRGVLTRWLFEIAPGVFVGRVSARVRELLWERIVNGVGRGRAIMVESRRNEQGLGFRVHGHDWEPIELEGIHLMLRPSDNGHTHRGAPSASPDGTVQARRQAYRAPARWSYAERRLRPPRARPDGDSAAEN